MFKHPIPMRPAAAAAVIAALVVSPAASANENVVGRPTEGAMISAVNAAEARAPARTLENPTQLPDKVRDVLGLPDSEVMPEAFGDRNHPFTTKRASALESMIPVDSYPWSPTGKLFMKFGPSTFVCTASVIRKGLLVTAAHCVHNFGNEQDGFADFVTFQPARHESNRPFGTWTAKEWWIPRVYFDGTDTCLPEAPGIVCENDVAVVVIEKKEGNLVGDLTGTYDFRDEEFGFATFLEQKAAQITQLGYPSDNFDGDKMIRTDSIGYQDAPNNIIIGSNQTGGSSGGPWIQNFGVGTSHTGTTPHDNDTNQVTATTSWGFTTDRFKVQGASRFATNSTYTTKSNIESLVDDACSSNPGFCP